MNNKPAAPFDATSKTMLQDSETAAMYLEECLADGDMELFKLALKHVADARQGGMTGLAKATDLSREALYRSLSKKGNPRLDTLAKVLDVFGLRIGVSVKDHASEMHAS
ncbi:MAG: putative addiction module antidote protein [Magnetococcales bacterium]|nr:putative addiction module antidote protein [Magnetococcales bacterium]